MRISVCIVTRDRPQCCRRCAESVFRQDYEDVEVVVVDDATVRGSVREALSSLGDAAAANVTVDRFDDPIGAGRARDRAAERATGAVLCFLDDDAYFESPDVLRGIADAFSSSDAPGILALRIQERQKGVDRTLAPFSWMRRWRDPDVAFRSGSTAVFKGGGFAIRRDLLRRLGAVSSGLTYMSGEESDLAYRVIQDGHALWYDATLHVRHAPGPPIERREGERSRAYHRMRNRIYLLYRYVPLPDVLWLTVYWIGLIGFYLASTKEPGAVLKGIRDGLRQIPTWPRDPLTGRAEQYVRTHAGWLWP